MILEETLANTRKHMPFDSVSQPLKINQLSFADVLAAVRTADLPNRQRQELASALRTVGRALDRPLERIQADPRHLSPRLKAVAPRAIGMSPRSWNNIRYRTREALSLVRPMSPGRNTNPLSPSWDALWRPLESKRVKTSLSRFVRWCCAGGIEPEVVSEANFLAFRNHLLDETLVKNPDAVFAEMIRGWRSAQTTAEGWPRVGFTIPDRRDHWTLPWSAFPASLREDCEAWSDRLAGHDLLDEAPFRPVRPSTVERRKQQIRAFASALALRGRDPATITSLKDLVEIDAYKEGLRFFIERSGGKSTTAIVDLAVSLKAIARHHLRLDNGHLDRLAAINRRLSVGPRALTEKNRGRLRQFDDPDNVAALLGLPHKLISIASRKRNPRAGALLAQIAAAIEILTMAPLRLDNLRCLDIEQNLVRPSRRSKQLHVVFPASDVKNRQPVDHPLPAPSVALIERYTTQFRPHLASPGCTALFPGRYGGSKGANTLGTQITQTIRSHTGLEMNPHLFRHATAKIYLDANPGAYEVVRRVLGHRSGDTTSRYYTGGEAASAARHFDDTILKLRESKSGR
jgi:integrase